MGIRHWIAGKIATSAHRNPEPGPGPDAKAASGSRAAGTGPAIAASRDAAQSADAARQAWFQYLDGQEPANETEARWFQAFRDGDRRAQARYSEERQAWQRYAQGKTPAHDAEARWFQTFREAGRQAQDGYREEHRAFHRYAQGQAPGNDAERQRFARFEQELAQADYEAEPLPPQQPTPPASLPATAITRTLITEIYTRNPVSSTTARSHYDPRRPAETATPHQRTRHKLAIRAPSRNGCARSCRK